jgi:hypothetical protein
MNRTFFDDLGNYVAIPRARFVQEHKKLLKVLENKDPRELEAERKEQASELKVEMKKMKKSKKGAEGDRKG